MERNGFNCTSPPSSEDMSRRREWSGHAVSAPADGVQLCVMPPPPNIIGQLICRRTFAIFLITIKRKTLDAVVRRNLGIYRPNVYLILYYDSFLPSDAYMRVIMYPITNIVTVMPPTIMAQILLSILTLPFR